MKDRRKNLSVGINFICGLIGVVIGFALQPMYYYWGGHSLNGYYIAGVSLFPIVGSIIELKNVRVGSIICLISGIILIAMSIFPIFVASIPFFLIIAGSILGINLARKVEGKGVILKKRKNISVGLSLIGGFLSIIIGILNGILSYFTFLTILMIFISLIPIIGVIIELKRNLFIGSIICTYLGIILIILIIVGLLSRRYLNFFVVLLRDNFGDLARLIALFLVIIPYLLIIVGGALGILETREVKES